MFKRVAPQRAQHTDGYIVEVADRHSVRYVNGDVNAQVEVDFAPASTTIYMDTLVLRRKDGVDRPGDASERQLVLSRIKDGMKCLGVNGVLES